MMHANFIKYCGFTRLVDALYASSLGVDALGFVFYEKSPRYIQPMHAASVIQTLKQLCFSKAPYAIGLFVNHSYQEVVEITKTTHVDVLQFHGAESADFCESLAHYLQKSYIKVISIEDEVFDISAYEKLKAQYPNASAFLLDKKSQNHGGSGQKFNWQNVDAQLWLQNPDFSIKNPQGSLILAGGIFLEDMDDLFDLKINAIDLSTGIEIEQLLLNNAANHVKGIKSAKLMYEIAQKWRREGDSNPR